MHGRHWADECWCGKVSARDWEPLPRAGSTRASNATSAVHEESQGSPALGSKNICCFVSRMSFPMGLPLHILKMLTGCCHWCL